MTWRSAAASTASRCRRPAPASSSSPWASSSPRSPTSWRCFPATSSSPAPRAGSAGPATRNASSARTTNSPLSSKASDRCATDSSPQHPPTHRKAPAMSEHEVPVLIIGGGGCGLSASIFLSNLGVEHLLVERHASTSLLPKAHYLNQRTMEAFRQHGVADAILAVAAPIEKFGKVRWTTSLGGDGPLDRRVIHEMDAFGGGALRPRYEADSACLSSNYPQLRLEPLLREQAERRAPGRIRYHHEVTGWEQGDDGVTVAVRNRDAGEDLTIKARYVIAADGGRTVGPKLGVQMAGPRNMVDMVSTHFSCDLSEHWDDGTLINWFLNPEGADSWGSGVVVQMGPTWGRHSEEFVLHSAFRTDGADWALLTFMNHGVVDAGIGLVPGAPVEVNTGAFHALFSDTRLGRALRARAEVTIGTQSWEFQAHDVEIGFTYEGGAVVDPGSAPVARDDMGRIYTASTKPGHRLPHAWLDRDGQRLSTYALAGQHGGFVPITGTQGHPWAEAAATAADKTGVTMKTVTIGDDYRDADGTWAQLCQISEDGAILVRPDNHVAWRSPATAPDPAGVLTDALCSVLGR